MAKGFEFKRVGVAGAGALGVMMAGLVSESGAETVMWVHSEGLAEEIRRKRVSPYFPGHRMGDEVRVTGSMEELSECGLVIVAVSSGYVRAVAERMRGMVRDDAVVLSGTKGLEEGTLLRMTEVISDALGGGVRVAAISGPNFAEEIARRLPAASVAACEEIEVAKGLQEFLSRPYFRVYSTDDVTGVELGGATKNVIAIAAGMCEGLGLGDNARAALITRGLAEMMRLGVTLGARPITFSGLAGIGDLVLTATSMKSRNYRAGLEIGKGGKVEEAVRKLGTVEGVAACKAILGLAKRASVEMPISREVERVLFEGERPADAARELMGRQLKLELLEFRGQSG